MGPTETYGPFRCAAEATLVALRRLPARQALLGSLELLTRDPLMEWVDDGAAGQKGGKHTRRGSSCGRRCAARTRILGAGIRGDGGVPPGCGSAGCWRPRRPPSSGQGMRYAFLREKLRLCLRLSSILRPQ